MNRVAVRWLGRVDYGEGLERQSAAARRCAETGEETLLLLEHGPVFTLGRNASRRDILFTPERCAELGIGVHEADRGGKVTYHGPGQLVGYPILDLSPDRRDVRRYVRDLEETLIRVLARYGIEGARSALPERVTSVWVGNDKIAAIGVHVARDVTTHGFALNVTEEPMAGFAGIVPCGIVDGGVTSIAKALTTGVAPSMEMVRGAVVRRFGEIFGREIIAA